MAVLWQQLWVYFKQGLYVVNMYLNKGGFVFPFSITDWESGTNGLDKKI